MTMISSPVAAVYLRAAKGAKGRRQLPENAAGGGQLIGRS